MEHSVNLRPLRDRVAIRAMEESETKTAGGLYIPSSAKEKPVQGRVVAVGQGRMGKDGTLTPLDVKVGDMVLYGKYAGTEVKYGEDNILILREEDILAVIG